MHYFYENNEYFQHPYKNNFYDAVVYNLFTHKKSQENFPITVKDGPITLTNITIEELFKLAGMLEEF